MIKYMPHRGGLAKSMAEAREFDTESEMLDFVFEEYKRISGGEAPFDRSDLVIGKSLGDDERIGWKNMRHICVKRYRNENYMEKYGTPQCIAWCGE